MIGFVKCFGMAGRGGIYWEIFTRTSLSPPSSTPIVHSVFLFLWLNGWSCHIWCTTLLNDNMDLHMSSLSTSVPKGLDACFMQQGITFTELWHIIWFFNGSDLISHTQAHTQHTQRPADWRTYINIYLHHLLCAQSSYLYYIKWLNE